jgi:uncharacterized membrane protein
MTVASQPLAAMPQVMRLIDASPGLYPVLLHGWMHVSRADVWVRLLSAIFGWLAVVVIWRVGARSFGWRAGLAAAAVMAIAPGHVHYAQYVRNYSLFTLLLSVHLWLVLDWFARSGRPSRRRSAALATVTAALLYTHYLALLLLPAEGLYALWHWRAARSAVLGWAAAVALGALLFLPGVPLLQHNIAYDRMRNLDRPPRPPLVELVPTLAAELTVGQRSLGFEHPQVQRVTLIAAVLLVPGLALAGLANGIRNRQHAVLLLALVALLPVAVYIGSGRRLVAVRFFLPFMAGYVVLAGYGLSLLGRQARLLATVALAILCAVPLAHFYTRFAWSYDHRRVAEVIRSSAGGDEPLLVVHPFEAFFYRWYLGPTWPIRGLLFTPLEEQERYVIKPPPFDLDRARDRIVRIAQEHDRFWVVGQSPRSFRFDDPGAEVQLFAWLDAEYLRLTDLDAVTGGDPLIRAYGTPPRAGTGATR